MMLTFVRRTLVKGVRANIAPSQHICNRVSLPRTHVIYHGVTPCDSKDAPEGVPTDPTRFAFVGRLVSEKGADVLLKAANRLAQSGHKFRVTIVGDGPERARLEKMVDELGIRSKVEFAGWVPPEIVNRTLYGAIAVVIPSVCEDVAPLVALEQMAYGRLIIASDIGGLGELVGEYGMKFPASDANELAICMLRVMKDSGATSDMVNRARGYVEERFTAQRMIRDHLKVYRTEAFTAGVKGDS